jgi:hypothetical protein
MIARRWRITERVQRAILVDGKPGQRTVKSSGQQLGHAAGHLLQLDRAHALVRSQPLSAAR